MDLADLESQVKSKSYEFQWYVDSVIDPNTHLATPRAGEQPEGNFYFYYENAENITLSYRVLMLDGRYKKDGGSVTLDGSGTLNARDSKNFSGNCISTKLTAGVSSVYSTSETGTYLEWKVEFDDKTDGKRKSALAYTYLYKPLVQPVGCAANCNNFYWDDFYNSQLTWVSGVHKIVEKSVYDKKATHYPNVTTSRGLVPFASSDSGSGVSYGNGVYVQFPSYFDTNTNNSNSKHWISTTSQNFKTKSFRYSSDAEHNPGYMSISGDTVYAVESVCAPTSYLNMDTSRYQNLNQIPNLTCGFMVTDDENSESECILELVNLFPEPKSGPGYCAEIEEYSAHYDKTDAWVGMHHIFIDDKGTRPICYGPAILYYGDTQPYDDPETFYTQKPLWQKGNENDELKYLGKWDYHIPSGWKNKSGWVYLYSSYWTHEDTGKSDEAMSCVSIPVYTNFYDKSALRDAVKNAENHMAKFGLTEDGKSHFYDSESSEWKSFISLYNDAQKMLGAIDYLPSVSDGDHTYTTCNDAAKALNDATAALDASGRIHKIDVNVGENGEIIVVNEAYAGKKVSFNVVPVPYDEYEIDTIDVKGVSGEEIALDKVIAFEYSFVMPDQDVIISASFKASHIHKNELTKVEGKTPTCTEDGEKEHYVCSCGLWFADDQAVEEIEDHDSVRIEALGHDIADFWSNDETAHWYACQREGCDYQEGYAPHRFPEEASEDEAKVCLDCGYILNPSFTHEHVMKYHEKQAPSCTKDGSKEYYECKECGKWFIDEAAEIECVDHDLVIPALGHVDKNGDKHCDVCKKRLNNTTNKPSKPVSTPGSKGNKK